MDDKINNLFARFYLGDTSAEEENILNSEATEDKKLFAALKAARAATTPPSSLEDDIRRAIARTSSRRHILSPFRLILIGITATAAVLIFASIHCFFSQTPPEPVFQDSPELIAEVIPSTAESEIVQPVKIENQIQQPAEKISKREAKKSSPPVAQLPTESQVLAAEAILTQIGVNINNSAVRAVSNAENIEINNTMKNILK